MISLKESNITDILPASLKNRPDVRAISYAISNQIELLYARAQYTRMYAAIDELPEAALDLLAIELQAQYYDQAMSIEVKRGIIKNTIKWHYKAGTASAVQELVDIVFGDGDVEEWKEYGGDPFHFQIAVSASVGSDLPSQKRFAELIDGIKNARSHLDTIVLQDRENIKLSLSTHVTRSQVPIVGEDPDGGVLYASTFPDVTQGLQIDREQIDLQTSEAETRDAPMEASTYPDATFGFEVDREEIDVQTSEQDTAAAAPAADDVTASTFPDPTMGLQIDAEQVDLQQSEQDTTAEIPEADQVDASTFPDATAGYETAETDLQAATDTISTTDAPDTTDADPADE